MAEPEDYEEYFSQRLPYWSSGEWAEKWQGVLAGVFDLMKEGAFEANLVGLVEHCPSDAVEPHGRSRMLRKLSDSFESLEAFRLRVQDAWNFWSNVTGTPGLTACLVLHGENEYPDLVVYDIANDDWLEGYVNGAWGEDQTYDNWSRASVVIPQPHPWTIPVVGPSTLCGPDTLCGITMTTNELSNIRRTFREHRPAHIIGEAIVVLFDPLISAEDYRADHSVTTGLVRMPLQVLMCGHLYQGAQCGVAICGQQFT